MATKTKKTATRKPATKGKAKKLTAAQADKIVSSTGSANGEKHVVESAGGQTLIFPTARWSGDLRTACAIGQSFKAAEALWNKLSAAKLAKGVDSRNSPHSAKSVSDSKAKAAPATKKPTQKAKAQAKAEAQGKAKITLTAKGKAQIEAGKDTGATKNVIKLSKTKTVQAALDAGLKMADINYARKCGTIEVA